VGAALLQRPQRLEDQRVRLALVEREQVVGDALVPGEGGRGQAVARARVVEVRDVEHAVLVDVLARVKDAVAVSVLVGLLEQPLVVERVVVEREQDVAAELQPVAVGRQLVRDPLPVLVAGDGEHTSAQVERHLLAVARAVRVDVEQEHRVVAEVGPGVAVAQVEDVERRVEPGGDRQPGREAVHLVEPLAHPPLMRRLGRRQRHVQPAPGRLGPDQPRRRVVRQRDLRQRGRQRLPHHGRPTRPRRRREALRRRPAEARHEAQQQHLPSYQKMSKRPRAVPWAGRSSVANAPPGRNTAPSAPTSRARLPCSSWRYRAPRSIS
jgi:hypothetical protein